MSQRFSFAAYLLIAVLAPLPAFADSDIERGKYLVTTIGGCGDCHTPGHFTGGDDTSRLFAGSNVGFGIPGLGVVVARNLTPDKDTGLGNWSPDDIVKAITTGLRPDGRMLAPVMPWKKFALLKPADAEAIAAYLKSLPPVHNKVPGPFKPDETPNMLVMTILPGPVYAALPKPPK